MMANWRDTAQELEELIRTGQGEKARELLVALDESLLPPAMRVPFSRLARRCHLISKAFSITRESFLSIKDRPEKDPALAIEYAFLLSIVGSQKVALKILSKLESLGLELPAQHHFVTGCVELSFWNYKGAETHFRKFVSLTPDPYMRVVGNLNLIACLVVQKKSLEAEALLSKVESQVESDPSWQVLRSHLHELRGQKYYHEKKFEEARQEFLQAYKGLEVSQHPSMDFVRKWLLFMDYNEGNEGKKLQPLVNFQDEMRIKKQYEICREVDRFIASETQDSELKRKVFFGTPFKSYKDLFFPTEKFAPEYLWSASNEPPKVTIDLVENRVSDRGPLPTALHRLLTGLTMDFYKAVNYGALFELIYPKDYYDPVHGPNRVFQLVNRLRKYFEEQNIAIEIVKTDLGFTLHLGEGVGIWVRAFQSEAEESDGSSEMWCQRIATHFASTPFDSKSFAQVFNISQRTASRVLSQLVQNELLERKGSGRSILYQRVTNKPSQVAA